MLTQKHTSAMENKSEHLGKFSIREKAVKSGGREQTTKTKEGYFISNPLFNMLLNLPSSIKTNDLSSVRHGGRQTLISFPWKKRCDGFSYAETVWNANEAGETNTRGNTSNTPASLGQIQRCTCTVIWGLMDGQKKEVQLSLECLSHYAAEQLCPLTSDLSFSPLDVKKQKWRNVQHSHKRCIFNEHLQTDLLALKWRSSNAHGVSALKSY